MLFPNYLICGLSACQLANRREGCCITPSETSLCAHGSFIWEHMTLTMTSCPNSSSSSSLPSKPSVGGECFICTESTRLVICDSRAYHTVQPLSITRPTQIVSNEQLPEDKPRIHVF
ncbi:hypothetical protein AG1IA_00054 [Rhizoctonia solani AG-1 IA]|uniref:Uncharacterized protein n=1 Tax=Thanatephorus cucumeris (strain AG1-IA) TaxID=983506 RepID=L8XA26_THACA|nr:hypothetical protein AG1IA_00054 [Rhizoctonia solani AG-1 IA]